MKWNWGTGIVAAFGLFIAFILSFVIRVQSDPAYDNEMVVKEYYKADSRYSEEMQRLQNAADLSEKPFITTKDGGVLVTFPESIDTQKIKGKVSFYRPSAGNLDFELPILVSGNSMLIPKTSLAGGRWEISLAWDASQKSYLIKKQVYL
jgi:nitrogen fixation protein FixH